VQLRDQNIHGMGDSDSDIAPINGHGSASPTAARIKRFKRIDLNMEFALPLPETVALDQV
jgi:hypothetical protein